MTKYFVFIDFGNEHVQLEHEGSLKEAMQSAWREAHDRKKTPLDIRISPKQFNIAYQPDNDGWQTISPIERL